MRTKTLLLSAVIGAAGVASSMAQTVYSVNIVGYINLLIPKGLSLAANQLDASGGNTLPNVFGQPAGVVTSLSVSKFNPAAGSFVTSAYDGEAKVWSDPTMTLDPGEGAFIDNDENFNPDVTVTLVGQVRLNSTIQFAPGLKVASSVIPQAGAVDPALEFPKPAGIFTLSKYNRTKKSFDSFVYDPELVLPDPNAPKWTPSVPVLAIGEAFFSDTDVFTPAFNWTRNFQVGQP